MKCRKDGCEKEVDREGMVYCSRDHAPYGNFNASEEDRPFPSEEKTASSGIRERGAPSALSKNSGQGRSLYTSMQKLPPHSENTRTRPKEHTMLETPKNSEPALEGDGKSYPMKNETARKQNGKSETSSATQLRDSLSPSETSETDESNSMSLIDSSVRQMHGLMSCVAEDQRKQETLDPQKINAAANCAIQLTRLIRLKLDIYKGTKQR